MSLKRFIFGLGVGAAAGYLLKNQIEQSGVQMSPEKALREVKRHVESIGTIDGTWIHMVPETYTQNQLDYDVYRGGVSCTTDDELKTFEFLVDASTGTVLRLYEQES
ncbi:PepSY domain-containing protein [Texcoconibacillus texcoconensis]|uniref:Putative small secreted protein n=1 Tax=Texcoconibacillus texcoconensis TaxID=1095777 RepID=A0A840QN26_9BACI|nr:PepSY domain-containing protein [Texcoconibacillus texcoconensis]MBB5172792.1 putative small secreted protein [Texcoconibacillus texcoconensis]